MSPPLQLSQPDGMNVYRASCKPLSSGSRSVTFTATVFFICMKRLRLRDYHTHCAWKIHQHFLHIMSEPFSTRAALFPKLPHKGPDPLWLNTIQKITVLGFSWESTHIEIACVEMLLQLKDGNTWHLISVTHMCSSYAVYRLRMQAREAREKYTLSGGSCCPVNVLLISQSRVVESKCKPVL